jgi:hypothetical protein
MAMSDEPAQATETKRSPGRPKGAKTKPRKIEREPLRQPLHEPMHGRADDERLENYEFTPYEAHDALHIDIDTVRMIRDEYGYSLMWIVHEAAGKPFPDLVNARRRNGFGYVTRGNFGGALDFMSDKDGRIAKEGLVLMARPYQIEQKARAHDRKQALGAIDQMKRSHMDEGVNVPGGDHPSALAKNRHRQTFEPVKIPD